MYVAVSLKNGEHIEAIKASYKATRDLLLVCPECGDPLHFKFRQIPHDTPFFAHPKQHESIKLIKACSLRVGVEFQRASSVVSGISHGQLVNRFQKEFCKDIYESLGTTSDILYEFIKDSGFERLEDEYHKRLIDTIQSNAPGNEILNKKLGATEMTIFREGLDDVCLFLRSPYGVWVGNFLFQTAYFIAAMVPSITLNQSLGRGIYRFGDKSAIFIMESKRLQKSDQYAAEILTAAGKRNLSIPKIAATLVAFLILKWRFNGQIPSLMEVVDESFGAAEAIFDSTLDLPESPRPLPAKPKGTRHAPLCIGANASYSEAEMKRLIRAVANRSWRPVGSPHNMDWVCLSELGVIVHISQCEFVDRKSYEMQDGTVILRTSRGTRRILGNKVSWR